MHNQTGQRPDLAWDELDMLLDDPGPIGRAAANPAGPGVVGWQQQMLMQPSAAMGVDPTTGLPLGGPGGVSLIW